MGAFFCCRASRGARFSRFGFSFELLGFRVLGLACELRSQDLKINIFFLKKRRRNTSIQGSPSWRLGLALGARPPPRISDAVHDILIDMRVSAGYTGVL